MPPLRSHPWRAPRCKLRGKRKYFRRVRRDAEAFRLGGVPAAILNLNGSFASGGATAARPVERARWWDFWHYHADWRGWGNRCWSHRREHLRALAVVFRHVVDRSERIPAPFQVWLLVDDEDAGSDAVFMHSPNPNGSEFPWKPEGVAWRDARGDDWASAMLPGLPLRVGRCAWVGEDDDGVPCTRVTHLVYSPGTGLALE